MPENVNTSVLNFDSRNNEETEADDREVMIDVSHVSMVFNMASESLGSLKEYFIKLLKHDLFFEEFVALDDVSFQVRKGDVFGIMGTNGSGKSTLLKIIAGVLEPTKGSCKVNGGIAPLIELGAGFDTELSARENIYLNGALLGYSHEFLDEHFDEIVEFAEIEKFLDMPLKNYSSGMISRIAFAIATVIVPEILLVDEVLSVGDFMFQRKCERRIQELIENHGVTVLIVSHSNDQVARLCNKCIWVEKGHTRIEGDARVISSIYGTLGGRLGSSESEQCVFDALKKRLFDAESIDGRIKCIEYRNQAHSCVALAKAAWGPNPDTVILASEHTHATAQIATPLSYALDAPVLSWNYEEAPVESAFYLQGAKPSRIVCIDCSAEDAITNVTKDAFDWSPEIVMFRRPNMHRLSIDVFTYGKNLGLWGSAVAVADFFDRGLPSYSLSLFAARARAPFILFGNGEPNTYEKIADMLTENGATKVYIGGPTLNDEVEQAFNRSNLEVERIGRTRNEADLLSLQLANFPAQNVKEVIASSSSEEQWVKLFGAPSYLAKRNGALLLESIESLDSITSALNFCASLGPNTQIIHLQGGCDLDDTDIELLASQLK